MDFFSNTRSGPQSSPDDPVDDFANAINARFGSDRAMLTARLPRTPSQTNPLTIPNIVPNATGPPSTPLAAMRLTSPVRSPVNRPPGAMLPPVAGPSSSAGSTTPTDASPFRPVKPTDLPSLLASSSLLILDIRPPAAFAAARLPRALSLSVPSTLLKRPLFGLDRIGAMLGSGRARARFDTYTSASAILIYDADATNITGGNVGGLLRKFEKAGYKGALYWVVGGFAGVWREARGCVDTEPPSPDPDPDEDEDEAAPMDVDAPLLLHPAPSHPPPPAPALRTRQLPVSAFNLAVPVRSGPVAGHAAASAHAANPFFDAVRQNTELSHGITERIPLRLPRRVRRRAHELPFEWLRAIARGARAAESEDEREERRVAGERERKRAEEEGMEALAMQFYRIELAEQRRLMGVMEHHSKESGVVPPGGMGVEVGERESAAKAAKEEAAKVQTRPAESAVKEFPYSITAGVEKGAKNRYRHIWPFEHARVRLHAHGPPPMKPVKLQRRPSSDAAPRVDEDDYVNASYVQPLGTTRRYIATQGPLPATFADFWTLCWEQNVHVIVMLTKEIEGAMVKCGTYWTEGEAQYGPLRLRHISTTGATPNSGAGDTSRAGGGGFFGAVDPPAREREGRREGEAREGSDRADGAAKDYTVVRTFELTHTGFPHARPRRITHLQYLDWLDMNVPDDPRGVLALMRQVRAAQDAAPSETVSPADSVPALAEGLDWSGEGEEEDPPAPKDRLKNVSDRADPRTGVALHALGRRRAPVLLHCSAGVGRTGGFIAVDAVLDAIRREMVKMRRGGSVGRSVSGSSASSDVDAREEGAKGGAEISAPVPVRVVDALKTPRAMAVDSDGMSSDSLERAPSFARSDSGNGSGSANEGASGSGSGAASLKEGASGSGSGSGSALELPSTSGSGSGSGLDAGSGSGSAVPFDGKTREWAQAVREETRGSSTTLSSSDDSASFKFGSPTGHSRMGRGVNTPSSSLETSISPGGSSTNLKAPAPKAQGGSRLRTTSVPVPPPHPPLERDKTLKPSFLPRDETTKETPPLNRSPSPYAQSPAPEHKTNARSLPTWIEAQRGNANAHGTGVGGDVVASASMRTSLAFAPDSPDAGDESSPASDKDRPMVDYHEPRALHQDGSPPPLSTYEDPIWHVVQDMREQRMSLCQSLRQYVFVHQAIIEGALQLVDEMNGRGADVAMADAPAPPRLATRGSSGSNSVSASSVGSSAAGKRRASPTELMKENTKGEVSLSKRPSIKRSRASDSRTRSAAFLPAMTASTVESVRSAPLPP